MIKEQVALRALSGAINNPTLATGFSCEELAFERLRLALIDKTLSPVDKAIRLRHALRYADTALAENGNRHSVPTPQANNGWPVSTDYAKFGLTLRAGGLLEAEPWCPDWLESTAEKGVDATAMQSSFRPWNNTEPVADPWIKKNFVFTNYKGPGQALAVRSALHMPDDQTLLILLPTSEGKSLVFQALAVANPGKTIAVVVPTVALAIDQAKALEMFPVLNSNQKHAYIGGQNDDNEQIRSAVANGTQGLVFAAPESIVKGLRQSLCDAARGGNLAALIIDEAHIVDAWGTDFRSEYQLLSALVAELREIPTQQKRPGIICLSATVNQGVLQTLEILFSPEKPISIVPAIRLRPEPDIWVAPVSSSIEEREKRVIEALHHLPRPAVLYVTTKEDANNWLDKLKVLGFKRIQKLHGDTSTKDREKVIAAWKKGELDLVVGTSAFGLGIDYPHVRTVIHACVPESLDRYYQEIGRSGRDNCASIALLIPYKNDADKKSDYKIARSLSFKSLIKDELGIARWETMFNNSVQDQITKMKFWVDPSIPPQYDPDMRSKKNIAWNLRVLNLMARAGLIRLSGFRFDQETQTGFIAINIIDDVHHHLERTTWENCVDATRKAITKDNVAGFEAMKSLIQDKVCPSLLFSKLYTLNHQDQKLSVVLACGGCKHCRKNRTEGWFALWPTAPIAPWSIGNLKNGLREYCNQGRIFVERDTEVFNTRKQQRQLKELINGLWDAGVHKCIVLGKVPDILYEQLSERPWCVNSNLTDQRVITSNDLPNGPVLIWSTSDCMPAAHHFNSRQEGNERIFILPSEPDDPANPGRNLKQRFHLITFGNLHEVVKQ
jgi:ATP-dependent DNA helicase RecQ